MWNIDTPWFDVTVVMTIFAIGPQDQVIGGRQRPQPVIDHGPDLRLIVQHLMQHGVDGRQLVLQPMLKFLDHQLAVGFFLLLSGILSQAYSLKTKRGVLPPKTRIWRVLTRRSPRV